MITLKSITLKTKNDMKKEYQEPSTRVHKPVCAPCKAYPWPESQMPATGGYAWPQKIRQAKEEYVNEEEVEEVEEVECGNIW